MGFNANVLKMDKFGNVKPFTFILSTKNYKHLGQLNNVKRETIDFKPHLRHTNELSFEVYKEVDNEIEKHWKDITDLKSIYVPELNEYFEIEVVHDDKLDEVKTIMGKSLCEAELGQTYIRGTEINTEIDIDRVDYTQTTFYNGENPKASLLHRVLSFAPHYSIKHVDASLCNLQRSFSIDGTSIYDFLMEECSEQFSCLFVFDSTDRSISVYDLYTTCNDCGHRDAYNFVCPKCGSTNVSYFGEDTDIFVNKENLTDDIKFQTDVGSIKNCLRLRSGDDVMDAAIISMNPNGTPYIYYITPEQRADMTTELVEKIDSYDTLVKEYTPEYQELAQDIRDIEDEITYYEYTMMPAPIEDDEEVPDNSITKTEIVNLTEANLSPLGMEEMSSATSKDTADSVVKNYARVFVNTSLVNIDISQSSFEYKGKDVDDWDYGIWTGKIKLTAYSDANDIAITDTLTLTIHDNYGNFLQQKVMKDMALNDEEGSLFDVLSIEELDDFKVALQEYCLSRLRSFRSAIDTAIATLMSLDQASEEADWYEDVYVPYYNKLVACDEEIIVREATIKELTEQLVTLYARRSEIQAILNFEDYLGEDLYLEFCTYRREGEYHNENYISDRLSNAEIIDRAKEFIETAKKELIRSATGQHTISANLYNLMLMEEFKPLLKKFALGNFIRVRVGKELYRLRLISYHINFSDLSTIDVEFSDMTRDVDVVSAIEKIVKDTQSMASNISYISKQAEKGEKANESVNDIVQSGLNSALSQIKNNVHEETLIDNNGYLGRSYNDITGTYDPEQVRITHNLIVFTEDGFKTVSQALGKHKYTYYDSVNKKFTISVGYGMSSKFVQAGYVYGSQIIGGSIYSENYSDTEGSYLGLNDGSFSFGGGALTYTKTNGLYLKGKVNITDGGKIGAFSVVQNGSYSAIYSGTSSISSTNKGIYLGTNGIRQYESSTANVTITNGVLTANGATINGTITSDNINATGGTIGGINISANGLYYSGVSATDGFGFWKNGYHSHNDSYIIVHAGANGSNIGNAKFRLYQDGSLYVSNINVIGGSITGGSINIGNDAFTVSSEGKLKCTGADINARVDLNIGSSLGGWETDINSIFKGTWEENPTDLVFMCTGSVGTVKLAGTSQSWVFGAAPNFGVTKTGAMYCSNAHITGGSFLVTATSTNSSVATIKVQNSSNVYTMMSGSTFRVYGSSGYSVVSSAGITAYNSSGTVLMQATTSNLATSGTKPRIVTTQNYNTRMLYCYETPTPMFGDIGEGRLDETGTCYVYIDDIFSETIDLNYTYQVFLQKYGDGDCYVAERNSVYFVVKGTPNMSFGWELKTAQFDSANTRLEYVEVELGTLLENEYATESENDFNDYIDSLLLESEE